MSSYEYRGRSCFKALALIISGYCLISCGSEQSESELNIAVSNQIVEIQPTDLVQGASFDAASKWIKENAILLAGSDPSLPSGDLLPLIQKFEGSRVIGIGEGTHGTKEFFQIRDRIMRSLIEIGSLDGVLWETNLVPSLEKEDALNDPAVALNDLNYFSGLWATDEVTAMLSAIRANNLASEKAHVRFLGIDSFDFPGSTLYAMNTGISFDGDAPVAVKLMKNAIGLDIMSTCEDVQKCYEALNQMTMPQARAFTEAAYWLADSLEASGAHWTASAAARTSGNRVRHIQDFAMVSPVGINGDVKWNDLTSTWVNIRTQGAESLDVLLEWLREKDPVFTKRFAKEVAAFGPKKAWHMSSPGDRYTAQEAILRLQERLRTGRYETGGAKFNFRNHITNVLLWMDGLNASLHAPVTSDSFDNYREVAIADNVVAALNGLSKGGYLIFSAHNGHVGSNPSSQIGRVTSGTFIWERLGDDYLRIGTFAAESGFQARDGRARRETWDGPLTRGFEVSPEPHSMEESLLSLGLGPFALDLRDLPEDGPVREWFETERVVTKIGNTFNPEQRSDFAEPVSIVSGFDMIIFFPKTSRATPTAAERARSSYDVE